VARRAAVDVVGLGQSSLDHVCLVDGLPRFAGKEPILAYRQSPGGQVATAMLACRRLGLRPAFVGSVGDDPAADLVLAPLAEAGVDVSGVVRVPGAPTQLAVILVDRESGERTVLWHRDARLSLVGVPLDRRLISQGRALHLDASDPSVALWAARVARDAGIPVILDADAGAPGIAELLHHVDFPIVSREFAEKHFGTHKVAEALRGLVEAGARLAVVTLGDRGALARAGARLIPSPAFLVEAKDTTGAGDVFHAAFTWGLLQGHDAETILRVANGAAAMNCRAIGAQGGLATRPELEAFLARHEPRPWRDPDADP
jgi:sugar/nucleoside kinase (ribokinase family)